MNNTYLPPVLDRAAIRSLETDSETAVRLVLRRVSNAGAFRLKCKHRTYILERDSSVDAHILDIPSDIWMRGHNRHFDISNASPCNDIFGTRLDSIRIIPQTVPWHNTRKADQLLAEAPRPEPSPAKRKYTRRAIPA